MRSLKHKSLFIVGIAAVMLMGSASAATKTWITAPAANSTNWNQTTNWTGGTPVAGDLLAFTNSSLTTLNNDLTANLSLAGFLFNSGASAFTINGNAITLTGGITNNSANAQIINNNLTVNSSITISNSAAALIQNITLGGNLSGSGTITQTGGTANAWTLNFSGTNSGFTGAFTQDSTSGNRTAFNNTNAGSASATWTFNRNVNGGVALNFGAGTISFGSLSGGAYFRNNAASTTSTVRVGDLNTSTNFSGQLQQNGTGTISLLKAGTGTFTLSGTGNSYAGATIITNGAIVVANGGSIGSGSLSINGGSSLINSNNILQTFSGGLSGSGTFTQAATNLTIFSGTSTYTGTYQVQAGAIEFQNTNAWGSAAYNSSNGVVLSNGGAVIFGVTSFTNNLSTLYSTFAAGSGTAVFGYDTTGTNYTIASNLADGTAKVGIASAGSGTLNLTGNNSFTGGVWLYGGTLGLTNVTGNGIGANTITIVTNSTVNALSGLSLANSMSFLNSSAVTLNNGGFNVTNSGNITGSGALTLSGAGTTTLSGSNTISVTVGSGVTLALVANAANTSAGVAYASGQIGLPGAAGTSGYRFLSDSSVTFSGFDSAGGYSSGNFNFFAGNVTAGNSNNVISFMTNGASWQNMTNNFDGTNGYSFALGTLTEVGNQPTLFSANSASVTIKSLVANSYNYTLVLGGTNTGYNAITNGITGSKTTSLTKTNSGTWYVLGASTGLGNTTISGGTLVLGGTLNGGNYSGTIANSGVLVMTNSAAQTLSGAISGTGSFAQSGTGTTTLSVSNNYSGGTIVNAGQLLAGAANSLGTNGGNLTVNGGTANLSTYNFTNGTVTLAGGTLTGSGTLTATNGYALTGGTASMNLGGSSSLTMSGTGTATLASNNTYSGTTTISGGTLNVIGTNSGGGAVNVNAGGTLAVLGASRGNFGTSAVTVAGGTSAANSGSISLNDGTYSTLTVNNLTLGGSVGSNAILNFDAGASGVTPTNASIIVTGALTLNAGGVVINLNNVGNSLISGLTENLITFGSLNTNSGGTFTLANPNISFGVYGSLTKTATAVQLITTGSAAPVNAYYSGGFGSTWTNNNGTYGNFTTDGNFVSTSSNNNVQAFPAAPSTVIYNNATNVTSTLGQAFTIQKLNFTGTGTATISNDGNTLTVGAGGLNVSNGSTASILTAVTASGVTNAGSLTLSNATISGTLANSGTLTNAGNITNNGTLANTGTYSGSGTITGTGGISNSGTMTLSGSNSFTGATLANGGTLTLSNTYALGSSAVTVAANNALGFANGITSYVIGSLSGNGALNLTNASGAIALTAGGNNSNSTYSGNLGGTGSFTKAGSGTLTLSGVNSNTGGTTVSAGSLALGTNNALLNTGTVTVNGGQFDLAGYNQTLASLSGSGTVTSSTGNGTLTLSNAAATTVGNNLTGGLSFVQTGSGTTTVSVNNTFTGGTTINAGQLYLTANNGLGSGTITINNGGWLQMANSLTLTNNLAVSGNTTLTEVSGGGGNFNGNLSGSGTLIYFNNGYAGALNMGGSNGVFAGTFIQGFNQVVNNNGSPITFNSVNAGSANAAWVFNDTGDNNRLNVNIGSGTISFGSLAGNAQMNDNASGAGTTTISVGANNSNSTYNGYFKQANNNNIMALQKVGTGTLTLAANAGYQNNTGPSILYAGGTTINAGALVAGSATAFGTGTLTVAGGTANLGGFTITNTLATVTGGSLTNGTISNNGGTYTFNNSSNVAVSAILAGSNGLTQSGNGTTTLSASNTYSGGTTVNAGTLVVSNAYALGSAATNFTVNGGSANLGTYNFSFGTIALGNGTISGVGNLTNTGVTATNSGAALIANNLVGTGGFTQSGGGTTTLSGNNTYSGATVVTSGGLQVNGSLGSSSLSLSSGTLSMTNQSTVSYSFTNGITLGSAVALSFDVIGSTNDSIATTSALTFSNSTVTVNILSSGLVGGTTNTLMNWGSTSGTGSFTLGTTNALGFGITSLSLQTNATSLQLVINGNSINGAAYWVGNLGNTWTTNDGTVGNFATNAGATTGNANALPASQTDVYFAQSTNSTNTLGKNFVLNSLNFTGAGTTTISNDGSTLTVGAGGVNVSSGSAATVGVNLLGAGGVTNNGSLTLSASNSYSGGTAVNAGTVAFGTANSFGTGTISLNGGTILNGANGLNVTNAINVTSASVIKMLAGGNFTLSGNILGNGNISYTDTASTGWLYLAGTNSGYSGTFTAQKDANGNKVEFLNANAGSSNAAWVFNDNSGSDRLHLNFGNGTISFGSLSGSADIINLYTTAANTSTIREGDLNLNDTYYGNIGQDNSGTYKIALLKVGTGTLTLAGYNQMQGGITVNSGVLNVSAGGAGGGIRTALTINTNATVNLTVGDALGYSGGAAATTITINGGTLNNATANNNGYITSFVLNGGTVTNTGGGRFDVQSGYGVTSLSNSVTSLWSAQLNIRNTGNLLISNAIGSTINGIDLQISGPVTEQYAGSTVTKTGNGTTLLSGTNTYTGTTTISGGTLLVSGLLGNGSYAGSIANSASLIFSNSAAQTLSGAISGTGAFTKSGAGTVTLSVSNSYSGGTTISGGTLALGSGGALYLPGTVSVGTGATLMVNSTAAVTQGSSISSSVITGAGGFTQAGTGTTTLNVASNTYTGGTLVTAGSLALGVNNALIGTGTVTVNGGQFDLAGYNQALASLGGSGTVTSSTGSGTLTMTNDSGTTVANTLTGGLSLAKTGAGTTTLSASNSYSGGTAVNAGTVAFGSAASFGTGTITLNGGGIVNSANSITVTNNIFVASNSQIRVTSGGNYGLSGNISGNGNIGYISDQFAGNLTLGGNNSGYTGTFTQNYGQNGTRVIFSSANAGSAGANWVFNDYAGSQDRVYFQFGTGTISFGSLSGVQSITANNGSGGATTLRVGDLNSNTTYSAGFKEANGNTIALLKVGNGTQTLSGASIYSGGTTVQAGTLTAGNATAFGTGTLSIAGGTANLGGFTITNTLATVTGGALTNGTISNNGGTYTFNSGSNVAVSAILAGSNGLTQSGNGTTTLSGNNTYSGGSTINGGTLAFGAATSFGTGTITLGGGTIVNSASSFTVTNAINVTSASGIQMSSGGNYALSGNISGNGAITYSSTQFTGDLGLGGTNNGYTGSFTAVAGQNGNKVTFNNANAGSAGAAWTFYQSGLASSDRFRLNFGTGTISFGSLSGDADIKNVYTSAANTSTISVGALNSNSSYSGIIGQDASSTYVTALQKVGTGTLTLTGASAFKGGAAVNAGTIAVGNSSALGSGTVTLNGGGIVDNGSSQTIANAILVNSSSQIRVSSAGYFTLNGNISGSGNIAYSSDLYCGNLYLGGDNSGYNGTFSQNVGVNGSKVNFTAATAGSASAAWVFNDNNFTDRVNLSFGSGTISFGSLSGVAQINDTASGAGTTTLRVGDLNTSTSYTGALNQANSNNALALNKVGSGTLTLAASSSYAGGSVVNGGTLLAGANNAFGSGNITVSSGATLALGSYNVSNSAVSLNGGTISGSGTLTASTYSASGGTISSSLSGGSFTKSSLNTLTLSANNTFTGGMTVSGGSIAFTQGGAFGSGAVSLADATSLNYNGIGNTTLNNNLSVTSGMGLIKNTSGSLLTLAGNLTKTGTILELAGGSFNVTGSILGNSGSYNSDLIISNAAVTLSGNNSFNGPISLVAGSTLTSGTANALPSTGILTIGGAGDTASVNNSFNLNGNNQSLVAIADAGAGLNQILNSGNNATLSLTGNSSFGAQVNGNINLNLTGSGTTSLTGNNGYTGTTTINGGKLNLGSTGKLSSTTAVTVTNGGSLLLGGNNQVNTNATVSLAGTLSMGGNGSTRATSQTFSTLTLTGNSVIDFANLTGTSSITFSSIVGLGTYTLSIYDWSGTNQYGQTSSGDATFLYDLSGLSQGELNNIRFFGTDGAFLGQGAFSGNQIVPVPEPGVIIAAFMLLGLLLWSNRGTIATLAARRA